MPIPEKVKLGLVGCGIPSAQPGWKVHLPVPSIAWSRYFPQILNNPNVELAAVCDKDVERAKIAYQVNKAKEYYIDYDKMLNEADIEAVIITTPSHLHVPMTMKAIQASKHVLVEKPFAATYEEADKLVKAARKAKVKLVALPLPSNNMPAFNAFRNLIDKGVVGKVCAANARYSHMGPGHATWFYKPPLGGPVYDLGIYPVTTLTEILGPVRKVQAFCAKSIPERTIAGEKIKVEVEDNAVINLEFGNNILASIQTNYCTISGMEMGSQTEIHGTAGSLFLSEWDSILRVYTEKEVYPGVSGWFERAYPFVVLEPQVQILADSILQNKESPYAGERQRHVIEVLEAVLKSAKTLEIITLKSSL